MLNTITIQHDFQGIKLICIHQTNSPLLLSLFNWLFTNNQFTGLFNGYLCFFVSIAFIGVCTAVIGDVAAQLGCFIYLKDSVNAIAFVALGTSVPGIKKNLTKFLLSHKNSLVKKKSLTDGNCSLKKVV